MKSILTIFLVIVTINNALSQACGVYELKYIGSIESNSTEIIKIKLPNTFYFHRDDKKYNTQLFYSYNLIDSLVTFKTYSHLTSIYKPDQLIEVYKTNREFLPIILIVAHKKGREKEIEIRIPIDEIKFEGNVKSKKLTQIIIDFGTIRV